MLARRDLERKKEVMSCRILQSSETRAADEKDLVTKRRGVLLRGVVQRIEHDSRSENGWKFDGRSGGILWIDEHKRHGSAAEALELLRDVIGYERVVSEQHDGVDLFEFLTHGLDLDAGFLVGLTGHAPVRREIDEDRPAFRARSWTSMLRRHD